MLFRSVGSDGVVVAGVVGFMHPVKENNIEITRIIHKKDLVFLIIFYPPINNSFIIFYSLTSTFLSNLAVTKHITCYLFTSSYLL